jgi:hypothetical protein
MDDVTTAVAQAATGEVRAAFATMAQFAATIPKWCDSQHPIGAAYQAALYVLEFDFPRGRKQGLVPAAVLVRDSVEAVWRERDETRRIDHPGAPTDLAIMSGLWVDHRSIREVAKVLGRDEKGVRKRIGGSPPQALAKLTLIEMEEARLGNPMFRRPWE